MPCAGQLEWQSYGADQAVETGVTIHRVVNSWSTDSSGRDRSVAQTTYRGVLIDCVPRLSVVVRGRYGARLRRQSWKANRTSQWR
jgi:hypothetical protein